ncbi:MAG: UMP kinase [Methanosarcinales archaeon]
MKIVISIGGSVLISSSDHKKIRSFADSIQKLAKEHTIYVIVGGGWIAREYISIARSLGANEAECDCLGIDVTRINSRLLVTALGETAYPMVLKSYQDARKAALSGKIIVMGGLIPGQTTDAVSAVLAEYEGADLLINATSVDGVYSADPRHNKDAKKFTTMTASRLVDIVTKIDISAGSNSPIDLLAAKIIQRCGIRTIVIDGHDPNNIIDAVEGRNNGTLIE